jgi:hypothetical protein
MIRKNWLILLGAFLMTLQVASQVSAQSGASDLRGDWRLISFQTVIDGEPPKDLFGAKPRGYLTLTVSGRMLVMVTGETRAGGASDPERAALHKSMISYAGAYTLTDKEFVTKVDTSWNETWNGTEQRRFYVIANDKLTIDSAPAPSVVFPGKTAVSRLVWERVK